MDLRARRPMHHLLASTEAFKSVVDRRISNSGWRLRIMTVYEYVQLREWSADTYLTILISFASLATQFDQTLNRIGWKQNLYYGTKIKLLGNLANSSLLNFSIPGEWQCMWSKQSNVCFMNMWTKQKVITSNVYPQFLTNLSSICHQLLTNSCVDSISNAQNMMESDFREKFISGRECGKCLKSPFYGFPWFFCYNSLFSSHNNIL